MKTIGLTGGIGSGKTTVANMFSAKGIPVFISDIEGRRLLNTSKVVRRKVIQLLGKKAYSNESPDRKFIASKVFNNKKLLEGLNAIIHPKVAKNFLRWKSKQQAGYCIKESAILFETGGDKICDATITVTAPLEIRIERVLKRDASTKAEVEARLSHQENDDYRRNKADYIIKNSTLEQTQRQVDKLHKILLGLE